MNTAALHPRHAGGPHPDLDVRRAWLCMLLLPVGFGGAFLVGEGLVSMLGYDSGGTVTPPMWARLTATIPALLVFAAPAFLSLWFARRAANAGNRRGWVPAGLLSAIAGLFVMVNVLAYFVGG